MKCCVFSIARCLTTLWVFNACRSRLRGWTAVAFQTHSLGVFYTYTTFVSIHVQYNPHTHICFDSNRRSSMSVSSLLLLQLLRLLDALRAGQQTWSLTDTTDTEEKNVTIEVGGGHSGIYWDFGSGRIWSVRPGSRQTSLAWKRSSTLSKLERSHSAAELSPKQCKGKPRSKSQ